MTFVHNTKGDTLTDNFEAVWDARPAAGSGPRPGDAGRHVAAVEPGGGPPAQELADAGDPRYTWQVDPALVGGAEPWGAEIFARFIREELGWGGVHDIAGYAYAKGGLYDELVFIRCAPGRTNPLRTPTTPRAAGARRRSTTSGTRR